MCRNIGCGTEQPYLNAMQDRLHPHLMARWYRQVVWATWGIGGLWKLCSARGSGQPTWYRGVSTGRSDQDITAQTS